MEDGTLAKLEKAVVLYCANGKGAERAAEELQEALCGTDVHLRAGVAALLLDRVEQARQPARSQALHLLQLSWWPPSPPELAERAFEACLAAAGGIEPFTAEAEDIALLVANSVKANPALLARLESALADAKAPVRRLAAAATGRIGAGGVSLTAKVAGLLRDPEPAVGDAALESLSSLATLAPQVALPTLLSELERSEGMRRYLALAAVRAIVETSARGDGPPPYDVAAVVSAVVTTLGDPEAAVRLQAVALLGATGGQGGWSARVEPLVRDDDPAVAAAAVVALAKAGTVTPERLGVLERLLASGVPDDREAAFNALEGAGAATLERVRPAIERAAESVSVDEGRALKGLLTTIG